MKPFAWIPAALALGSLAPANQEPDAEQAPWPTAGAEVEHPAVLRFELLDMAGRAIPGRLTFVTEGDEQPELFPGTDAAPHELAVRSNVIYSLTGRGAVTVPPGRYTLYASRGLEWSRPRADLVLEPGKELTWKASLIHELDTSGWVSGDFHLHTLTHSGHGDSNLAERIISLVGEGVEFAVATDHNHNTDYGPTIEDLGAGRRLSAVTGNEVSTPIGHFNAFPLDPERAVVDSSLKDANELFKLLRAEKSVFDVVPVIQLNHPRWADIDYFGLTHLDPVTGLSTDPAYSTDFDSLEILNENAAWGYHEAATDGIETGGNRHSVLADWFGLLNRGYRYAAVGNSDSHTVHYAFAGYPRNFLRSKHDDPGSIDPAEVAEAIRAHQLFTTTGPFVDFSVGGTRTGGLAQATELGEVRISARVEAASWVDCDRLKIVVNGEVIDTLPVAASREPLRLEHSQVHSLTRDSWIVLLAEGDDALDPIVGGGRRPCLPLAITNPVWVDFDLDGRSSSPWEQMTARLRLLDGEDPEEVEPWFRGESPVFRALGIQAAVETESPHLARLVGLGFRDADRGVRLAAARAAEASASSEWTPFLEEAWDVPSLDPYLRVALLRAFSTCVDQHPIDRLLGLEDAQELCKAYPRELAALLGDFVTPEWLVLGTFDAPQAGTVQSLEVGPEKSSEQEMAYVDRNGREVTWKPARADRETGYLDLLALDRQGAENGLAYAQAWLHVPQARRVPCAFGTDDGSRVYLNDRLIHDDPRRRGANPLERLTFLELTAGWNRLLFKVENGTGSFGLYCRLFDPGVRVAAAPEEIR